MMPLGSPNARALLTRACVIAIVACALAACEDEVTAPEERLNEGQLTLDATNPTLFTYMTFADGGSAVSVADPASSTDWDVAFRRYVVKLNGGVAGPSDVAAANLGTNAGASAEDVVAFTMADADAVFEAVTANDVAGAVFQEDGLIEDEGGSWFRFSPQVGNLVANPGAAWKLRQADGGFAVFRVAVLDMAGQLPAGATLEYRHQEPGGTLGDIQSVNLDLTQGPAYVDFSTGAVLPPGTPGCGWDLEMTPFFTIAFNADCDAGTFPLDGAEDFTAISQADDAPEYGPFLATISGAIANSITDASGLFWYNLEENQRMWPTFNVFLVRVGQEVYKMQAIDYYSATGESGYPTIRFERLQ